MIPVIRKKRPQVGAWYGCHPRGRYHSESRLKTMIFTLSRQDPICSYMLSPSSKIPISKKVIPKKTTCLSKYQHSRQPETSHFGHSYSNSNSKISPRPKPYSDTSLNRYWHKHPPPIVSQSYKCSFQRPNCSWNTGSTPTRIRTTGPSHFPTWFVKAPRLTILCDAISERLTNVTLNSHGKNSARRVSRIRFSSIRIPSRLL